MNKCNAYDWNIILWLNCSPALLCFNKKHQSSLMHTMKCCSSVHPVNWRALRVGVCAVPPERLHSATVERRDGSGAASEQTAGLLPTVMITHARYSAQIPTLLQHDSIQALNTTPCYIIIKKWWIMGCELLGTRGYIALWRPLNGLPSEKDSDPQKFQHHDCSKGCHVSHCNINSNWQGFVVSQYQELLTLTVTASWRCSPCQLTLWCDCCVLFSSIPSQTCNQNTGPALIMIPNWEQ